jgi:hypothetical protein
MDFQDSPKIKFSILKTREGQEIVLKNFKEEEKLTIRDESHSFNLDIQKGTVTLKSNSKIAIEASQVDLGKNSVHPLILGDYLLQYLNMIVQMYNTHLHPGEKAGGTSVIPAPPAPPLPPIPATILSEISKTE